MPTVVIQETGPKITDFFSQTEIDAIKTEMVPSQQTKPVRFLLHGRSLNISTGHLMSKGVNIIHQMVYWNFTRETAKAIAAALQVQSVFSE